MINCEDRKEKKLQAVFLLRSSLSAVVLLLISVISQSYADYVPEDSGYTVESTLGEWTDPARNNRQVPYKLYLPTEAEGPLPVVIWSHGAGGSRQGARYLGEHLASHGYAVFHIQHPGTDASMIRGDGVAALLERVSDPRATMQRFADIGFVVEEIKALNQDGNLARRFDTARIGMSGHSFGAITTLVTAGQQNDQLGQRFAVSEIRAAFAMSPRYPGEDAAYQLRDMLMPIFHLTGTNDEDPAGNHQPEDRQVPFQVINTQDQYLLVMNDGIHATFSDPSRRNAADPKLEWHHKLIKTAAVVFWDAYLKESGTALQYLQEGGYGELVSDTGRFQFKAKD